MHPKDAAGIANIVDPDQTLIWICIVCPDLSVRKLKIITVLCFRLCQTRHHSTLQDNRYEPPHDKPNKMTVHPEKTQISLGIRPVWSVFSVRMKVALVLSYRESAQRRLWSDWAGTQADLSLRWAHSHFVAFVVRRLILLLGVQANMP